MKVVQSSRAPSYCIFPVNRIATEGSPWKEERTSCSLDGKLAAPSVPRIDASKHAHLQRSKAGCSWTPWIPERRQASNQGSCHASIMLTLIEGRHRRRWGRRDCDFLRGSWLATRDSRLATRPRPSRAPPLDCRSSRSPGAPGAPGTPAQGPVVNKAPAFEHGHHRVRFAQKTK